MKTGLITYLGILLLTFIFGVTDTITFDTGWIVMSVATLFYPIYLYLDKLTK